ncbi:MAG TPA: hypothetical protein VFN21_07285 [Acidimicrobiales bacterium]|nr:hypothetical protein [Acidimicrobiales bacterium]
MTAADFEIIIEGEIHQDLMPAFAPATATCEGGRTVLRADAIDQAALHGLFDAIAARGLVIVSVLQVSS